jgi:hypothetical protein
MCEYTVETGIPYTPNPDRPSYSRNVRKYPWHTMSPGASFVVATLPEARSAHNSFMSYRRSRGTKIHPSWFIRFAKQEDGTYRLWLLDKNDV